MKGLFSDHIQLTGKVLDLRMKRQNVVMSNLANIRTPGYKPLELEWESELQAALNRDAKGALSRTNEKHVPSTFDAEKFNGEWGKEFRPHIVNGDDSVDLDKEMAKMSKNLMMYNALATVLKKNFEGIKTAISEGQK